MSDEPKAKEDPQPKAKQAPAARSKDTKDQPEPQYSFDDWAAI